MIISGSSETTLPSWLQESPAGGVRRVAFVGESDRVSIPQGRETDHRISQGDIELRN